MRKLYITLSFLLALNFLSAQNKDTKKADKLFDRYEYVDAIKEYQKLVDNGKSDLYVESQLAECNYNIFNTKEAVKWFEKIAEPKNDAETYFKYSQMLKAEGNYSLADKQMAKFASLAPNDNRAVLFKNNPSYLSNLNQQPKLFDVEKLHINSDKSDFGAQLTNQNELYFISARNTSGKNYGWDEQPYYDIYKSVFDNGNYSDPVAVSELNTKYHEGAISVASNGKSIYYGSESFNEGDFIKDKSKKLKLGTMFLFEAVRDGNSFGKGVMLPFNNKEYSVRNPSISKDGKTLYFSSDMPGGIGGEDIWKIAVSDLSYGTPENLGTKVNTEGNESFPFIDNNVLYFSSDSRLGYGGYDVYKVAISSNEDAVNLGKPINSEKDDFAFSYNNSKKLGYVSSNREGVDNIYSATPICWVNTTVIVKDSKTNQIIEGASISMVNNQNTVEATDYSKADGKSTFNLNCNKPYSVQVSKKEYENGVFKMDANQGGNTTITALLQPVDKPEITPKEVVLNEIYFEFNKSNITPQGANELDRLVQVMNEDSNMVIYVKSHTDNRGSDSYNMNLSERRAQSTVQYIISKGISKERISGKGFGETEPKVNCESNCTEEQHAQNRRSEFLIVKK